jgi:hypothetical protein
MSESAAAVSAAAAAVSAAAAAVSAAAAAAASTSKLYPRPRSSEVILVEQMERRQANVGDFLVTENNLKRGRILGWYVRHRYVSYRSAG